jgi:hypothetical protein
MSAPNFCPNCKANSRYLYECSACGKRIPCANCQKDANAHPMQICGLYQPANTETNKMVEPTTFDSYDTAIGNLSDLAETLDDMADAYETLGDPIKAEKFTDMAQEIVDALDAIKAFVFNEATLQSEQEEANEAMQ